MCKLLDCKASKSKKYYKKNNFNKYKDIDDMNKALNEIYKDLD